MQSQTASISSNDDTSFTFAVANVKPATRPISQVDAPTGAFQQQTDCKDKIESFSHAKDFNIKIIKSDMNGVMTAIHQAFNGHYPLKLSVSDFVLMIAQGISKHMEVHAEDLRAHFVDFEGKEKISINRPDLIPGKRDNNWETVFETFGKEIKARVKTDLHDVMVDDTSVATKLSRIASEIAIMDAFKHYFEYEVRCICGIPKITLVGSKDDWERLRTKVKKLVELNADDKLKLAWWLERLVPLVDKIVDQAVSREMDTVFWEDIYQWQGEKEKRAYAPSPKITGWIQVFNPYLVNKFGKLMESTGGRKGKSIYKPQYYRNEFNGISRENVTSGTSTVPFIWAYDKNELAMSFHGGFLGAKMLKDLTIQPVYFYAVTYDSK